MHATRFHPVRMAAISINNIAVALLCKGSIQEGMEMLTNAVKLMKFVSEEPSTENDADWAEDLRQAQKYSSKSMHCDEQSMSFHIKTIYSQAPAYSLSQSSEFFDRVPMPIYIEQITMEEGDGKAVLLFECAIVLYNLGLSHSLLAQKSATATCSLQNAMRESSLHVMELAEKVLTKMYEHCHSSSTYIHETIVFNIILMRGLIHNKLELNRAAREHCKVLSDLLSFLWHQRLLYPENNELGAASAA